MTVMDAGCRMWDDRCWMLDDRLPVSDVGSVEIVNLKSEILILKSETSNIEHRISNLERRTLNIESQLVPPYFLIHRLGEHAEDCENSFFVISQS